MRALRGHLRAPEAKVLLASVSDSGICIDIGAHCGSWSLPLARKLRNGTVIAFEALPYYANLLTILVRLMSIKNIKVINRAVGDNTGQVSIVWRSPSGKRLTGLTHIATENYDTDNSILVQSCRIDDVIDFALWKQVQLIKCDIEGAELAALRGAKGIIREARPIIYCEINDLFCRRFGHTAADVFYYVKNLGYQSMQIKGAALEPIEEDEYEGVGDVVFIPLKID